MRISKLLLFLLFFILLSFNDVKAFMTELDSLIRIIQDQKDGIEKADNLQKLAKEYANFDKDSAMLFAEQSFALSSQINYDKGVLRALSRMGYIRKGLGDYNAAFEYYNKLVELSEQIKDSLYIARGYMALANLYRRTGKDRIAMFYHKRSIPIYQKLNDDLGLLGNYNSLGSLFKSIALYDSAVHYYMKSINTINRNDKLKQYLVTIYQNLGGTYKKLQDYKNARMYLFMALDLVDKETDKEDLIDIYTKLGNVSNDQGYLDSALYYYKIAEPICRDISEMQGLNDLYINYGIVFEKKGLYELAKNNYKLALKYYKDQNLPGNIVKAWQWIASIYTRENNYIKAFVYLDSCNILATKTGLRQERLSTLLMQSDIYYKSGNYKRSYDFFKGYTSLKDSIYQMEKEEIIAELRIQYDSDLKQAKIIALEYENLKKTRQRNRYLISGLGIIALSIFIVLYLRLTARKNRIISEQRIRQLEEEKKLLAARFLVEGQEEERKRIATELHDGLGVLLSATKLQFTSIKDVKPENKPLIEKATQFLEQASTDVRKISHNMMPGLLTKLGLCEALEDMFEQLDENKDLNAVCEIKGTRTRLPENQEIMIYRIVQEMVNNTLKHAEAKNIKLGIDVGPDSLNIRFADDGKGFDVDRMIEKKSMGLQSIKSRVRFLDGTVDIESGAGKGTVYTIKIPV